MGTSSLKSALKMAGGIFQCKGFCMPALTKVAGCFAAQATS